MDGKNESQHVNAIDGVYSEALWNCYKACQQRMGPFQWSKAKGWVRGARQVEVYVKYEKELTIAHWG